MTKFDVIKKIDSIELDNELVKEIAAETIADYMLNSKNNVRKLQVQVGHPHE